MPLDLDLEHYFVSGFIGSDMELLGEFDATPDVSVDGLVDVLPSQIFGGGTIALSSSSEEVNLSSSSPAPAAGTTQSEPNDPERQLRRRGVRPLPRGSVIDKYRVEELLGTGAFAVVYRATHLLLHIPVAIKMLLPKLVHTRPRLATLLCEEARFAARVNHPNVVRVWDVTRSSRLTYIVMEYLSGPTLAQRIRRQKSLTPREIIQVAMGTCSGLLAALQQGLIHRDIKPSNILFAEDGTTKIIDLGLARPAGLVDEDIGTSPFSSNAVVGTPAYMSPEHANRPSKVDYRADIYSLGATLYHGATGRTPFVARTSQEVIRKHALQSAEPIHEIVEGFPVALSQLIMNMMAKERAQRPESYEKLLTRFGELATRLAKD